MTCTVKQNADNAKQAKELMREVEAFKTAQSAEPRAGAGMPKREPLRPVNRPTVKPGLSSPGARKPLAGKSLESKRTVGVAVGNGKDHHSTGNEFEEF